MDGPVDATPRLDQGLADLAGRYRLILCDVWGVIHNGVTRHPAAVDALQRFRAGGGTVVLVTNAPAPARNVMRRLDALGVARDAYDAIATSGDVTIAMIVEAGCPPVLNIGPPREIELYSDAERLGGRKPRLVGADEAELVIAISPCDSIGPRPEDYDTLLRSIRARGLTMICANPDIVVEVGDALHYCAGAIAERYEAMGGTVIQAGKPFPAIYERALALAWEHLGRDHTSAGHVGTIEPEQILAIGDAMRTDMRGARNQGYDALFITSGIHRAVLHGSTRAHPLDRAALRQLLTAGEAKPVAALGTLSWMGPR